MVHCEVLGDDYDSGDPFWKCTAELPVGLLLGTTDVSCEGFLHPDDANILRGSCGLRYTLRGAPNTPYTHADDHSDFLVFCLVILFLILVAAVLVAVIDAVRNSTPSSWWWWGPSVSHHHHYHHSSDRPSTPTRTSTGYGYTTRR